MIDDLNPISEFPGEKAGNSKIRNWGIKSSTQAHGIFSKHNKIIMKKHSWISACANHAITNEKIYL